MTQHRVTKTIAEINARPREGRFLLGGPQFTLPGV
jgi:hypothetical protein